ncbi:PAP2-domain-containing protein [Basidiobolus meristosporus CBS 931.73]|uniref:PAP2-domain-containing protein n=1 Tax=Basidiobolus meristosporus CBS 931.73 TaxID=1314790 RepID=A0A1Y1YDQ8_9FUNG|nr:PAP2-domain-containing protein [Basidiobolus meristosporus CBS 931.73]|eukprot:ORX96053.1 PAP2-domain-containing protein [Basidiobolus meristosporus CBS 931.73]
MTEKKVNEETRETDFNLTKITFPEHLYDSILPPHRAALRNKLLRFVRQESELLAKIQASLRCSFLDQYFIASAVLGNHLTFLIILPHLFMFGIPGLAREMVHLLLYGVVITAIAKDYLCLPRPASPPVHRLSINKTHHLEYGFPSTHTACCVGVGLSLLSYTYGSALGFEMKLFLGALSMLYMFSVSFGRIYCGMHSITDILGGIFFGTILWVVFHVGQPIIEKIILFPSVLVLVTLISTLILIVHYQPDPIDACPCFEDSVASLGAIIGVYLGSWQGANGSSFWTKPIQATFQYQFAQAGLVHSVMRVLIGFVMIIGWRIVAKKVCYLVLPGVYKLFNLPVRKFHKPARKYKTLNRTSISMVPSVVNLDTFTETVGPKSAIDVKESFELKTSASDPSANHVRDRKGCSPPQNAHSPQEILEFEKELIEFRKEQDSILPRYDVDILTKLIVYSGIGWWATLGSPALCYYFGV